MPESREVQPDPREWKPILKIAGVRDARLHDARHAAATLLLTQGVAARVAMQILGHSQINLNLGTYSHVVPELARDAADRMAAALWDDPTHRLAQMVTGMAPEGSTTMIRQPALGQ